MVVESRIAARRGLLADATLERLINLLRRCGLPTKLGDLPTPVDVDALLAATRKVRLIRDGSLRYVLPCAPGETLIADDVDEREVREALRACGA
jgi:3-dehydroquinate synthetase